MPPQGSQARSYQTGDVIWVYIKGLPWWPGQVMDVGTVTEKMKAHQKPNTRPINTFGDNQYCWASPKDLKPFAELFDRHSKQQIRTSTLKATFKIAVEEAQQLLDERAGRTSTTNHTVLDFLKPVLPVQTPETQIERYDPPVLFSQECPPPDDLDLESVIKNLSKLALNPNQGVNHDDFFVRLLYTWRHLNFKNMESFAEPRKRKQRDTKSPTPTIKVEKINDIETRKEKPLGKKRKSLTAKSQEVQDEEMPEVNEEEENASSDAEISDVEQEESSQSEGDVDQNLAEERPAKSRRRSVKLPSITLTEDNEWNALCETDPEKLLNYVRAIASSQEDLFPPSEVYGPEASGLLAREEIFTRSVSRRDGVLGELATNAATMYLRHEARKKLKAAKSVKKDSKRGAAGIPVTKPKVGMTAISKVYEDRLPSSKEEFNKLLTDFYDRHGKTIQTPTLDYLPLDLEKVFRLVAAKGGYEVVTLNKQWPAIGREWKFDLSRGGTQGMHKKYVQHLLAFENEISQGAPETVVYPVSKILSKDKAALRAEKLAKKTRDAQGRKSSKKTKAKEAALERLTQNQQPILAQLNNSLQDVDPFSTLASSSDDEPLTSRRIRRSNDANEDTKRQPVIIAKSRFAKKPEVHKESFTSLLMDDNRFIEETKPSSQLGSLKQGNSRLISSKPSKPIEDQRAVLRLKFAAGIEMPTRSRLLKELQKHGRVNDIQMLSRQNSYTFKFDSERSATRAYDALGRKAHVAWRLPKESLQIFQEFPTRPKVPPKPRFDEARASSTAQGQISDNQYNKRETLHTMNSAPKPNLNKQPLKGIMKKTLTPNQDKSSAEATPSSGIDPRQMAFIPKASNASISNRTAQAPPPRPSAGNQQAQPPEDPRQAGNQQVEPQRQWNQPVPSINVPQQNASRQGAIHTAPRPPVLGSQPNPIPGQQLAQRHQSPNPHQHSQSFQQTHSVPNPVHQPPRPPFQLGQGPNPGNLAQDPRQMFRPPAAQDLRPPPGHQLQNPPGLNVTMQRPMDPRAQQNAPIAPSTTQHAAQAAQLTQQLTGMDPAILLNILKNVPNVDRTSQQGQNLGQTSQPSSSLPTVASMLQSAGIRPLPQGQVQSQGSLNPGFTNLGPQNHPGGQSQMINSQFQQGLSHNGEQVPKLAGEANQGQSADISGQLMALMNSFK